jgi:hypothetical protein
MAAFVAVLIAVLAMVSAGLYRAGGARWAGSERARWWWCSR